ncbi:chromate transporter [Azospirillum endophyticum]
MGEIGTIIDVPGDGGVGRGMELAAVLTFISILSVGGGPKLMAPFSHQLVVVHGWVGAAVLTQFYGMSRFLPGAGGLVLLTGLIGWSIAGPGGLLMPLAALIPPLFLSSIMLPWWSIRVAAPWKAALVRATGLLSAGQGIAGGLAILQLVGLGRVGLVIATAAAVARLAGMPVPVVLAAGGVCGLCL